MRKCNLVVLSDEGTFIFWCTECQVISLVYCTFICQCCSMSNKGANIPLSPWKNIEKSSWRFGSTTTKTEFPELDFAEARLAMPAAKRRILRRENMASEEMCVSCK